MCVDPITATLMTVAVAGAGVEAYGAYSEADAAKKEAQAGQVIAKLEGGQRELEMMREFEIQRSKNVAMMSASGLSLTSGSFDAFLDANRKQLDRNLKINEFNTRSKVNTFKAREDQARVAGTLAIAGGILNAASAGASAYTPGGGGSTATKGFSGLTRSLMSQGAL